MTPSDSMSAEVARLRRWVTALGPTTFSWELAERAAAIEIRMWNARSATSS